mgnify:CR=1 FL=1
MPIEAIAAIAAAGGKAVEKGVEAAGKVIEKGIEEAGKVADILHEKLSPEGIRALDSAHEGVPERFPEEGLPKAERAKNRPEHLTADEKEKLKEETGWSDEILDNIRSPEEAELYKNAGLVEAQVGDHICLANPNIDWNQKDSFGLTNSQRAKEGLSPLDQDGNKLELHHIGQHNDSPLAELTQQQHRGKGNDTILHNKTKDSEINRSAFDNQRAQYWQDRAPMEGEM